MIDLIELIQEANHNDILIAHFNRAAFVMLITQSTVLLYAYYNFVYWSYVRRS